MKQFLLLGCMALILLGCDTKKGAFLNTVESQNDLTASINKFVSALSSQGLSYFETIDHSKNAQNAGMILKPETVIVFGDPKTGTLLMQCNPSIGLDLPLRMLFTTDYTGKTTLTFTNPEYWSLKHNIKDDKCLDIIAKMKITMQILAQEAAKK
jgi:Uncharacterized conserved protein